MNDPPLASRSARVRSYVLRRALNPVQEFIRTEAGGGVLLLLSALVALVWANSPWASSYFHLWERTLSIHLGFFSLSRHLGHWVNDAMMVLFFFVVGLEIKREMVHGQLSRPRRAALPMVAALGGMMVPVAFFLFFNAGGPGARGWGIPMATDIAFAVGVLALLGERIPSQLRIFLLALAIVDDIGSILVIALFYTEKLSLPALAAAAALVVLILAMRRWGVRATALYVGVGVAFWLAVLLSGIHATIAGVILGLLTPARPFFTRATFVESAHSLMERFQRALASGEVERAEVLLGEFEKLSRLTEAPLERIERKVHPWSSYLVLPVFALANSGVVISSARLGEALTSPVTMGVACGLLLGKLVGVFSFSWLAVRLGVASLPDRATWPQMLGTSMLAGIGFTVALFIAGLSYRAADLVSDAKMGILGASLLAGLLGLATLWFVPAGTSRKTA